MRTWPPSTGNTENSCDSNRCGHHMNGDMRVLLALLALVGLLLSPVAASAATQVCLHHDAGAGMSMMMDTPHANGAAKADPCCNDDSKPTKHDDQSCAQACAVICGVTAALPQAAVELSLTESHARLEPAALVALHAHGPPGLKRPPKHQA